MEIILFLIGLFLILVGMYVLYISFAIMGIDKQSYDYHKEHDILSFSKTRLLLANAWSNF